MLLAVICRSDRVKTLSVIAHANLIVVLPLPRADGDCSAFRSRMNAVFHGILHYRLHCQRRNPEIIRFDIPDDLQIVPVAHLLQLQVIIHMLELCADRDHYFLACQIIEIGTEITREIIDGLLRLQRLSPAKDVNRVQDIEQKMRADLAHHYLSLFFCQLLLLFLQTLRLVHVQKVADKENGDGDSRL